MTIRLHRADATPCLHVVTRDGQCPGSHDEGCPHHYSSEQVRREIEDVLDGYWFETKAEWEANRKALGLHAVRLPDPCLVIECDASARGKHTCDAPLFENYDTGGIVHFDDRSDASIVTDSDWVLAEHQGETYACCEAGGWTFDDEVESIEQVVLVYLGVIPRPDDWDPEMLDDRTPGPHDVALPYPKETPA